MREEGGVRGRRNEGGRGVRGRGSEWGGGKWANGKWLNEGGTGEKNDEGRKGGMGREE